jgi:hypothetical protein
MSNCSSRGIVSTYHNLRCALKRHMPRDTPASCRVARQALRRAWRNALHISLCTDLSPSTSYVILLLAALVTCCSLQLQQTRDLHCLHCLDTDHTDSTTSNNLFLRDHSLPWKYVVRLFRPLGVMSQKLEVTISSGKNCLTVHLIRHDSTNFHSRGNVFTKLTATVREYRDRPTNSVWIRHGAHRK